MKVNYFSLGTGNNLYEINEFIKICNNNGYDYNVYSFEMNKDNYKKLIDKNSNKKVKIINKAISNIHNSNIEYFIPKNKLESSIYNINFKNYKKLTINSIKFSEWTKENDINLKIQ